MTALLLKALHDQYMNRHPYCLAQSKHAPLPETATSRPPQKNRRKRVTKRLPGKSRQFLAINFAIPARKEKCQRVPGKG